MKVLLKVLSPLHIGSGQEASPLDYYTDGTDFCRLDLDGLFADPGFTAVRDKFLQVAGAQRYIGNELPRELLKRHVAYRIPTAGAARRQLSGTTTTGKTAVKTCIKSAGRVYIPGSSIKGAILSALCWKVMSDAWQTGDADKRNLVRDSLSGRVHSDEMLGAVLTKLGGTGEGRFTHWLDVSDSALKRPEECLELSLAQVQGSRRGQIPVLYETLRPGTEFAFELRLDRSSRLSVEQVFAAASDFYRRVARADDAKDTKFSALEGTVRLGQGSGAFAVSLLVLAQQLQERYEVPPPLTRKRIDNVFPMGWAQLVPIEPS